MLIKDQITLLGSLIHIYFKEKFLDRTVSFKMPQMPDLINQFLLKEDQLTLLYINNNYLLNANELKMIYQAGAHNYKFSTLVDTLTEFSGETFIILRFEDLTGTYVVGGFNPSRWGGQNPFGADPQSQDSYIFTLKPQYKHLFTVPNQHGSKSQTCVIHQNKGISFGLTKEDARIWIDSFKLEYCSTQNSDRYFKKGALISSKAKKAICTQIEVYGISTDMSKKNFTRSIINVARNRDMRSSAVTNSTSDINSAKQSVYLSQINQPAYKHNIGTRYDNEESTKKAGKITDPLLSTNQYTPLPLPNYNLSSTTQNYSIGAPSTSLPQYAPMTYPDPVNVGTPNYSISTSTQPQAYLPYTPITSPAPSIGTPNFSVQNTPQQKSLPQYTPMNLPALGTPTLSASNSTLSKSIPQYTPMDLPAPGTPTLSKSSTTQLKTLPQYSSVNPPAPGTPNRSANTTNLKGLPPGFSVSTPPKNAQNMPRSTLPNYSALNQASQAPGNDDYGRKSSTPSYMNSNSTFIPGDYQFKNLTTAQ